MPVTAKLSKLFYERLGEQVTNELVEWFNSVDATYRADLRDLNEINFTRFDAKLEQRVAEFHAKLDAKIDRVAAELNAKIDRVAAELNAKIDRVAAELNAKIDSVTAELTAKLAQRHAELLAHMERRFGEQTRWFYVTWALQIAAIIGLWTR